MHEPLRLSRLEIASHMRIFVAARISNLRPQSEQGENLASDQQSNYTRSREFSAAQDLQVIANRCDSHSVCTWLTAAPAPVVECRNSRITARFSRELEPRLRVEYLTLENGVAPDCGYTESIDANFVTISIPFVGCGTSKEKVRANSVTRYKFTN